MIPASFEYFRPSSVEEAIQLLGQHEDAKVLAGGHSLIPLMKLRLAEPSVIIDIGAISGLSGIRERDGQVGIGALTTYYAIESSDALRSRAPVVSEAAGLVGDVQVRNRGTIGGSLVHADPGADLPAVILAMGATMKLRGAGGERSVPANEFFVEMMTSAVQPDELLTEVQVPSLPARTGSVYLKHPNPASGYSVVGVAAILTLAGDGSCQDVRIGVSGAGPMPVRASAAEAALRGQQPTPANIARAAERAADGIETLDDIHASSAYRTHLVTVYARRALEAAARRSGAGNGQ
jgi:carbon-monoxide dehydrogenase medium subunit